MSRKKRYIEKLTEAEQTALSKGYKTGKSHRFRSRCQGILLSHQGYTCSQLATMFHVHLITIYDWLNRWEKGGIDALHDTKGRGRKPILTLDNQGQVAHVQAALGRSPRNLHKVQAEVEQYVGVHFSKKTLQRFLKSLAGDGSVLEKVPPESPMNNNTSIRSDN